MQTSDQTGNLLAAIAKFHVSQVTVKKDATNGGFKTKYATLPAVLKEIADPLKDVGLCFIQMPTGDGGLTTRLFHSESGEWMQDTMVMKAGAGTPQAFGSAITYARRYALCAILSLSVEDDDGNEASKPFTLSQGDTARLLAAVGHKRVRESGKGYDILCAALKMNQRQAFDSYVKKVETANQQYQEAAANPIPAPTQ